MIGYVGGSGVAIAIYEKDKRNLQTHGRATGRFLDYHQPTIELCIREEIPPQHLTEPGISIWTRPEICPPDQRLSYSIWLHPNELERLLDVGLLLTRTKCVDRLALRYIDLDPNPGYLPEGFSHYT